MERGKKLAVKLNQGSKSKQRKEGVGREQGESVGGKLGGALQAGGWWGLGCLIAVPCPTRARPPHWTHNFEGSCTRRRKNLHHGFRPRDPDRPQCLRGLCETLTFGNLMTKTLEWISNVKQN